ncbi:MAG: hypothetical protein ABWY83_07095, partial [Actinomycetota bacterium]
MDDGVLCRPSPKHQSGRGGAGLDLVELDRRLAVGRGFPCAQEAPSSRSTHKERKGRIESVADRLFEGE